MTLNAGETFDVGGSVQLTLSGGLTGTGAITKEGTGALVVLGTSYTGSENVSQGVLIQITPYSTTYDGASHIATGTATGQSGDQTPLNLTATAHTDAGTYSDAWSYNSGTQIGSVTDVINKATLTASITGDPSKPYDGTLTATLSSTNYDLADLASGDSFTVTQTAGTYNSAHVVAAHTVATSLGAGAFTPVGGTLASNYYVGTQVAH